jgi:hypothetical protein
MNCPTVKNPENSQRSHFVDRNGYATDDVGIFRNALKSVAIWKFRNRQQILPEVEQCARGNSLNFHRLFMSKTEVFCRLFVTVNNAINLVNND